LRQIANLPPKKVLFSFLKKYFRINFSHVHTPTHMYKVFDNSTAMQNLNIWRDSNPGSSVLVADAMTTMPRRQGFYKK
jgi:hypothetical protein